MKTIKSLLVIMLLMCTCLSYARKPIPVVVITGQNNHNWPVSSVAFQKMLTNSGLFTVDIATSPKAGGDMSSFNVDFSKYKVVLLDYNGDEWNENMKKAFLDYVNKGGGVIVYHAADNSFPNWEEYNKIIVLGGWGNRTEKSGPYIHWQDNKLVKDNTPGPGGNHGAQHEYVLTCRDNSNPITKGLPNKWKHAKDELYEKMRGPGEIKDMLYTAFADKKYNGEGKEEPLIFTVDYGKARIFHIMLGHAGATLENNTAMQCTGFQVMILRGAEWCATGKVTQDVPKDFPDENHVSMRPDYK